MCSNCDTAECNCEGGTISASCRCEQGERCEVCGHDPITSEASETDFLIVASDPDLLASDPDPLGEFE